jgi:large subunit ribosomal protein L2
MKLKNILPITNGTRHQINLQKNLLTKNNNVVKFLFKKYSLQHGRSKNTGHITVRHKGSGCKKKSHITNSLDFYFGINISQMYNSFQNAFISLNFDFIKKSFFKTIAIDKLYSGSLIVSDLKVKDQYIGYKMQLKFIPIGAIINSISDQNKIIYSSSAGAFCQLIEKKLKCKIRLPSGKIILVPSNYFGVLGSVSNSQYKSICIGKAGKNRLKGIRPSVRGIAMNPVDHPHGGRTNGGRPSVTPWGIPTKGKPTVKKN